MTTSVSELLDLISAADVDDLDIIGDHITDNGSGRLALSSEHCKIIVAAKKSGYYPLSVRVLLVDEIRRFGGNSIANLLRGGAGISYDELLRDVAKHLSVSVPSKANAEEIEFQILNEVMRTTFDKMTEEQRQQIFTELGGRYTVGSGPVTMAMLQGMIKVSGFAAYKYAAIIANSVARSLLGRGLAFGATGGLMKGISAFAGPVGWALTALWTLYDLGSPAFRITVPVVIQLAYMRQKSKYAGSEISELHNLTASDMVTTTAAVAPTAPSHLLPAPATLVCPVCAKSTQQGKFCMECGSPLNRLLLS